MLPDIDRALAGKLLASIGGIVFATEFVTWLVFSGGSLSAGLLGASLFHIALLVAIAGPIIYATSIRPLVHNANAAEEVLQREIMLKERKIQELTDALSQRTARKLVIDRHAIVSQTDIKGCITYVNDLFVKMTGYAREEVIGKNYGILGSGIHGQEFWRDMYRTMARGGVWQGEVCNKRKDGTLYWVQATNSAMYDDEGRITGYVSVRIDITNAKSRELALKSTQEQLEQERSKAEAASVAKSNFLSTMSHEMRTPLNGVLGALDLLRDTGLDEKQAELVNIAHESGDALLVHINDVLDFSKMEAGKLELEAHPFVLGKLVSSVLHIVAPQAEQRSNQLESSFNGELPAMLDGDRIRIRQVLLNLVSNANKFTKSGRITVEVSRIGGPREQPEIEISVIDTGIGIPKDRLKDLFHEFTMLDSSYTRKTSGTGLGLAISKRLIEAMGGSIGVESSEGKGSRFWFRLALPAQWTTSAVEGKNTADVAGSIPKLKILLADDNVTNQFVASRMLAAGGHDVTTVNNGREALEAASNTLFDMILSDISMPEMDGIEATRRIRQLPEPFGSVTIVALTANAIYGDRERFLAAGMDGYLTKPLRRTEMDACLAELVGRRPATVREASEAQPVAETSEPIIDPTELERVADETSPDVVPVLVDEYLIEMKRRQEELLDAIANRNIDMLTKVTHAIAGASASTGACRLRQVAKSVELDCIAAKTAQAWPAAEQLPDLMVETDNAFRIHISKVAAGETEPEAA